MKKILTLTISAIMGAGILTGVQLVHADTAGLNALSENAIKIAAIEADLNKVMNSDTYNENWDDAMDSTYGDDWDDLLEPKYGEDWKDIFETKLEDRFNIDEDDEDDKDDDHDDIDDSDNEDDNDDIDDGDDASDNNL